jgi:hypothetical protein
MKRFKIEASVFFPVDHREVWWTRLTVSEEDVYSSMLITASLSNSTVNSHPIAISSTPGAFPGFASLHPGYVSVL